MNTHVLPASAGQSVTLQTNRQAAESWAFALTGNLESVFNWRVIHDKDKAKPAIKRCGTLAEIWDAANRWNANGYGIFATVNEMDGSGYD